MATIALAIDNIQNKAADRKTLDKVAELLRAKGHTVTTYGVGPNTVQRKMLSKSNSCDLMIQIAGGKCLGTLVDFYTGVKRGYYHAKAGGFMYFKCWDPNWKSYRSGDDGFSSESSLRPYKGKTLPVIYGEMKPYCFYGYGTTAEEITSTFLNNYNGSGDSSSSDATGGGGSNALELIKQAITSYDEMGMEMLLNGDTLTVRKANMNNNTPLSKQTIVNNSISYEEYDPNTPNQVSTGSGVVRDERLIEMYGAVPYTLEQNQVVQATKRGHGHSIDLKTLLNTDLVVGSWVKLYLDELDLNGELYYVTKNTFDEEHVMGVTLEPFPPSRKVEITEETTEEGTTEEEETTEEEA